MQRCPVSNISFPNLPVASCCGMQQTVQKAICIPHDRENSASLLWQVAAPGKCCSVNPVKAISSLLLLPATASEIGPRSNSVIEDFETCCSFDDAFAALDMVGKQDILHPWQYRENVGDWGTMQLSSALCTCSFCLGAGLCCQLGCWRP